MSRAVIDQPGVRILITGLVISIVLGLALRAQISEVRVQQYLNKSIDRLQSDFYIDYESARVNLAHWGLPFPALIIEKLRLSPKSVRCQSSQIYVEELEIPISFSNLLGISKSIPKIRAKSIELRLASVSECLRGNNSAIDHNSDSSEQKNIEANPNNISEAMVDKTSDPGFKGVFTNKSKAELKEIYVEKLKIITDRKIDQPVLLKQLNIELNYDENRLSEARLKSKMNALKDAKSDIYFLNSNLEMRILSRSNGDIDAILGVNGKLLDGDLQFFAHSNTGSQKLNYELSLDRVSARVLSSLMGTFGFSEALSHDKFPVSISFKNNGKILLSENTIESKFKNIAVNVINGFLEIPDLEIKVTENKASVKPFEMQITNLPISILKSSEQYKNKFDSFESLGNLSGIFKFKNEKSFEIKGRLNDIQVIFSNRSRRDLLKIENIDLKVVRSLDEVKFDATEFKINNQKVEGSLSAQYNTTNNDLSALMKLNGLFLSNQVWEQFTFVEQSPKVQLTWAYNRSGFENHNVKISVDKIMLPGVLFSNLNIDLNQKLAANRSLSGLSVSIKPTLITFEEKLLKNKIVEQIINSKTGFKLKQLQGNKSIMSIEGEDWMNLAFDVETNLNSERQSKFDSLIKIKGFTRRDSGLSTKVYLTRKNQVFKFEVTKPLDEEFKINSLE